ncbi:MAG: hypothetical protein R2867_02060 [Caldilineaceae bacterium]
MRGWLNFIWRSGNAPCLHQTLPDKMYCRRCGESEQLLTSKQLQTRAHTAYKALDKYAHVFPIGQPSAILLRAPTPGSMADRQMPLPHGKSALRWRPRWRCPTKWGAPTAS